METRVVGTVVLLQGVAFARTADGRQRQLKQGDPVFEGETVSAGAGGEVEIGFANGARFLLRTGESVTLGGVLLQGLLAQLVEEDGRGTLLGRVNEGTDPARIATQGAVREPVQNDETAGADLTSGTGQDSAHGYVRLDRIVEVLAPPPFLYTSAADALRERPLTGIEYEGVPVGVAPPMLEPAVPPVNPPVPPVPVNGAPVGRDDSVDTPEGEVIRIPVGSLLTNDRDPDGDPLVIVGVGAAVGGTVTLVDGEVVFTPTPGFSGPGGFDYTVGDGKGGVDTVHVVVTVVPDPADSPTQFGGDRTGSGAEDGGPITGTLGATDADGLARPGFTVVGNPAHGTATIDPATGAWRYVPAADFNGPDSFTVRVTDNDGVTSTQVIVVNVRPVADVAPNAITTSEDTPVVTHVLANDSFEATPV
ncbi:MAG: tandem-95 repeat protein, partial [Comamonadaceae bacterium]